MNITVLGTGAFGIGLSKSINDGNNITLCSLVKDNVDDLKKIYSNFYFTTNMEEAVYNTDLIIVAVPMKFLKEVLVKFKEFYSGQDIVIATKGIDANSLEFGYEIAYNILGNSNIGILSGGTFAKDMGVNKVMGITLGCIDKNVIDKVLKALNNKYLHVEITNDLVGVSICGAIKNVMAIGFGILDGAGYPESSRFMYLSEIVNEIKYFIELLGGNINTIFTYAGLDDIVMTCTSSKSRNYTLGYKIGSNDSVDEYLKSTTVEGYDTCLSINNLANKKGIYLNISNIIYKILYEKEDYISIIEYLEDNNKFRK